MKKWHLWLAASIGLVVIVGMMIREFDVEVLSRIDLSPRFFLGVVMGVLLFAGQNLMLTLRFRHSFGGGGKWFGFCLSQSRGSFYGQKYLHHVCSPAG